MSDGVGEGRQQVREGWTQRCTSVVPVVPNYTPHARPRAKMPNSLIYTLIRPSYSAVLGEDVKPAFQRGGAICSGDRTAGCSVVG